MILPYLGFMIFVSIPLFIAETTIGAVTQKGPDAAFAAVSQKSPRFWKMVGNSTILTGFFISSFYSVVTGWILSYGIEALRNGFHFASCTESAAYWKNNLSSASWSMLGHTAVGLICFLILTRGVKNGLEKLNRICMPLFFVCIFSLFLWSISLPGFSQAIEYLTSFQPTTKTQGGIILIALGHAFFTLSIGQGTLVTYGSYTSSKSSLFSSAMIIALVDTLISLLATIILISTVFSDPMRRGTMESGPSLLFEAIPAFFSHIQGGVVLAPLFFFFVFIAAITSQLSALEPSIRKLESELRWSRKKASFFVIAASWAVGILSIVSLSNLGLFTYQGVSWFEAINYVTTSCMLPLGAMAAAILFVRAWKAKALVQESGAPLFSDLPMYIQRYLVWSLRLSPIFIFVIFLHALDIW